MNGYKASTSRERGIVMPLVAISMLALIAMTGLALDMGHWYENKTRLQNTVDAAALSAAKTLDETKGDKALAEKVAKDTITELNAKEAANKELSPIAADDITVQFFELAPGACNNAGFPDCFVRVRVDDLPVSNFFIQVLEGIGATTSIDARAVAGPSPLLEEVCDVIPTMVCAQKINAGDPEADLDDDADDGKYYGYTTGDVVRLKRGVEDEPEPGSGSFQLINLDDSQGGSDICTNFAGTYQKCLGSENIPLKPGGTVGPVFTGLNTRFNIYPQGSQCQGEDKKPLTPEYAPPDEVVSWGSGQPGETYSSWKSASPELDYGVKGRRVVSVPIGNCPDTCTGASCDVPLLAFACFYLREPANHDGSQTIIGEFTNEGCLSKGKPGGDPTTGPGPYIIQLYKDPASADS